MVVASQLVFVVWHFGSLLARDVAPIKGTFPPIPQLCLGTPAFCPTHIWVRGLATSPKALGVEVLRDRTAA
eukprot:50019-Amphidinium_carterae.3